MRSLKIASAMLFLIVVLFSSLAFTQQKPAAGSAPAQQAYAVLDMQIKPGMGWEWESYLKRDLIPAAKKEGMTTLMVSKTEGFGMSDRYYFIWPVKTLAELDSPSLFQKALGNTGWPILLSHLKNCVERSRTFALIVHPDLSIAAKPGYVPKMGVMVTTTVAPGRTDEYEKVAKEMVAVFAKTNAKAVYVGNVGFGGNINQYMTSVFVDSFAELEQFVAVFMKASAEAKLPQGAGIVTNVDTQVFKTMPELEIQ